MSCDRVKVHKSAVMCDNRDSRECIKEQSKLSINSSRSQSVVAADRGTFMSTRVSLIDGGNDSERTSFFRYNMFKFVTPVLFLLFFLLSFR